MKKLHIAVLLLLSGCTYHETPDNHARGQKIAHLYVEQVWNRGNLTLLDSLLAPNYVNHTPSAPTAAGPQGLKPIVMAIRKAFPDLKFIIEDVIVAGDYITIRTVMTGTHRDTLFGVPPTQQPIRVNQINIERLQNGKIAEHWRVTDELMMMKQLGLYK